MTSQMESFSCNLVERILFPNSETSRPPRNFTAAITQAITLCPGELACFYECRAVAGGQLSSDVMEKWYLKILGPISEIKEQQNIHSILVLRNACGGGFPNYSLFVHFCVTTYHLVSTRFFWDLKKKKITVSLAWLVSTGCIGAEEQQQEAQWAALPKCVDTEKSFLLIWEGSWPDKASGGAPPCALLTPAVPATGLECSGLCRARSFPPGSCLSGQWGGGHW